MKPEEHPKKTCSKTDKYETIIVYINLVKLCQFQILLQKISSFTDTMATTITSLGQESMGISGCHSGTDHKIVTKK